MRSRSRLLPRGGARVLAASGARFVRNVPLATSVLRKHIAVGPVAMLAALVRGVPLPIRRQLGRAGRFAPVTAAIAVAAGGDPTQGVSRLGELARSAPTRTAGRAVDALTALHHIPDARAAREALQHRADAVAPATVDARLLVAEGHLQGALDRLGGSPARSARSLREMVIGDLDALAPGRRATVLRGRTRATVPVSGTTSVAHLVTTSLPEQLSGYTVRTQGIARAQQRAGREVVVIPRIGYPVDIGVLDACAETVVDGVRYCRLLPARPLPISAGARLDLSVTALDRLLARGEIGILHAHSKHHNAQVALAAGRRQSIPVVYEVRGLLEETWRSRGGDPSSDWYRLSREAESMCMRSADAVVTLSETMRREILDRGVSPARVHVVPNAVDERFLSAQGQGVQVRRRCGIAPEALVVGFAGTVNRYEGLETLIAALAALQDPQVHLLVVGAGPALAEAREQARDLGVRAYFTGKVARQNVPAHLDAMDAFAVPRLSTSVTRLVAPLKPIEALAVGLPVLASDLPPLRELATATDSVRLVTPGEVLSWEHALRELAQSAVPVRGLGVSGRQWAARDRTWSRAAQLYEDVYAQAREASKGN